MPRRIKDSRPATNAEALKVLEGVKEEEMGEFQRRTFDYVKKFSKISTSRAGKLIRELVDKHKLERKEAIQICNTMPDSPEELRTILAVKGRIIDSEELDGILKIVHSYRKD